MVKSMERELIFGLMDQNFQEIGNKIKYQGKVFINGLMGESTKENGN